MSSTVYSSPKTPPEVEQMVRNNDPNLTEADAKNYVSTLDANMREAPTNRCYVIRCMRPCQCPVGCTYNQSCNWCLWPGISTIPFGCCVILHGSEDKGYYVNVKGDTVVMKVDQENDTLACFAHSRDNSGKVCCYCNQV